MDLETIAQSIENKKDFDDFLSKLLEDLKVNKNQWENCSLEQYVGGLRGFVGDIEGFFKNRNENFDASKADWKLFALILLAARVYE